MASKSCKLKNILNTFKQIKGFKQIFATTCTLNPKPVKTFLMFMRANGETWKQLLPIFNESLISSIITFQGKRKEVLFVVDVGLEEERSAYHETAGRLAFILQRHGRIDVKCNLWYISTISDPHLWLMNNIKTADYVVLFLTPLKSKFISESNWITFLSTYSYQGFCIKPCGKMDDKIFLVHIADKPKYELSKSYKTYRIMNDFKKFFKNVTGKSVSKHIPKNVLENLEQVASLELIV